MDIGQRDFPAWCLGPSGARVQGVRGVARWETSMTPIRVFAAALACSALGASVATPAEAEIYRPWCAQYYGFGGGGTNCGFISYEQCMMTAFGAGAWCVQIPGIWRTATAAKRLPPRHGARAAGSGSPRCDRPDRRRKSRLDIAFPPKSRCRVPP